MLKNMHQTVKPPFIATVGQLLATVKAGPLLVFAIPFAAVGLVAYAASRNRSKNSSEEEKMVSDGAKHSAIIAPSTVDEPFTSPYVHTARTEPGRAIRTEAEPLDEKEKIREAMRILGKRSGESRRKQ